MSEAAVGFLDHKEKGLTKNSRKPLILIGGADRDRTDDLMNAIHALSQLSYSPTNSVRKLSHPPLDVKGS